MTLIQLEYAVAVDTYGNFSVAAEKCMVTQPTLSMQIRKLENDLGVTLFDRSRHPVITTAVGKAIVEQSRLILREVKIVRDLVSEDKMNIEGRLHIGIIPTVAPYLMPYFIGPFSKQFPEIELEIQELKTDQIVDLLQRDLLDAGILATPLHTRSIHEQPLYYEEILLYLSAGHKLWSMESIPPERLHPGDMWMLTEGNCFRDHVINLCSLNSDLPIGNLKYESGSLETLKKMVDVEGGHTLLPELAVLELKSRELARIRHFKGPVPLREISLVYARRAAKRHLMEKLSGVILQTLPDDIKNAERGHLVAWS